MAARGTRAVQLIKGILVLLGIVLLTQAASLATDTRTKAWSHIYLGRLLDLEGKRPDAVRAYRAALAVGDPSPDTKEAAEKGVQEGFASPNGRPPEAAPPEEKPRQRVPLGTRP